MKGNHTTKRIWCLLLLCLSLGLQVLTGCRNTSTSVVASPEWRGIVPGVSTVEDVVRILDEPDHQTDWGKYITYSYPSSSRSNAIAFQDGKVRLIIISTIEDNLQLVLNQYGEPEKVTWAFTPGSGIRLFIFARHGIAVSADNGRPPSESKILERWYFEPMSVKHFMDNFGGIFVPLRSPNPDDLHPEDFWIREP